MLIPLPSQITSSLLERSKENPLYNAWLSFRKKGKGCLPAEWYDDFHAFALGVGPKPSPRHRLWAPDFVWTDRLTPEQKIEKKSQVGKNWRKNYPERAKNADLKKLFGISIETYNALLDVQNGRCAICHQKETDTLRGKVKSLAVDHDHNTGKIRGLLCSSCNKAIGFLRDNPEIALRAATYLEEHNNG